MSDHGCVTKRRVGLMVVASWLLATVFTGLVVWRAVAVLDSGTRTSVLSGAQVSGLLASQTPTASGAPTTQSPGVTIPPATTATASTSSAAPATSSSTVVASPTKPVSSSTPSSSPTASPVARTWSVNGGVVSAACTGSAISLLYATPSDGWRVKIERRGPDSISVEFDNGDHETKIRGSCVAGVPQQTTGEHD